MEKIESIQLPFEKLDHLGIVVWDMEKALASYQALGIGPFEMMHLTTFDRRFRGKPDDDVKHEMRMGKIGQTRLELIQPISGESIHMNFLMNKGEGIHHLCFEVDSVDREVPSLISKGFRLAYIGKFKPSGGFAYFESGIRDSYYLEVIQWPSD